MRQVNWFADGMQDLHYAARTLRRNPGFALIAIITLALGIGANTAIFSVVHATLLQPLPYAYPEELVELRQTESAPGDYPLTGEDYLDWRAENSTFTDMSLYSWSIGMNASGADAPEAVSVISTQANFFHVLGVSPQIGRAFAAGEDRKGAERIVLLSDAFWKTHFGGRPEALGKTLELNSNPYAIIGVMPAWFRGPGQADLWVPLDMSLENIGRRGSHNWRGIGRIKAGVTLEQARADLRAIAERLEKQFPDSNRNVDAVVTGAPESLVGQVRAAVTSLDKGLALFHVRTMPQIIAESMITTQYETALLLSMAGLALLLAAVGTYGVMSCLVGQRTNEIGIRMALGARPREILAMVVRQAFLLVMIGTIIGWAGGAGAAKAIESLLFHVPPFDPVTYAGVSAMLALVALAACWIPVRRAMRVDPMVALRDE